MTPATQAIVTSILTEEPIDLSVKGMRPSAEAAVFNTMGAECTECIDDETARITYRGVTNDGRKWTVNVVR